MTLSGKDCLVMESVTAQRGGFSLGPVSLALLEKEYFVLLGPTGCGKTSLLQAVAGFIPCSGTIVLNGRDVRKRR